MTPHNVVLVRAVEKLATAGEQAGFSIEEMIELLKTGVSGETLLNLVCTGIDLNCGCHFQQFFFETPISAKPN